MATSAADYTGYDKAAKGYIRNGSNQIVATDTMNVQWFVNGNNKVYFWDFTHSGSSNQNFYEFRNYKVTKELLYDASKVLCITS